MTWESYLIQIMPYLVPFLILYMNIWARKALQQRSRDSGADMFLTMISIDFILVLENLGEFGNVEDVSRVSLSLSFLIIHFALWHFCLAIISPKVLAIEIRGKSRKLPEFVQTLVPQALALFFFLILIQKIMEGSL